MANAMPVTRRKEAVSRINKTLRLMRCFEECTEALAKNKPLPLPLCYERAEVYLKLDEQLVSSSIGGGASGLGGGGVGSGALHPTTSSTSAAISSTSQLDSNVYLFDAPIDDLAAYLNMLNNFEYLNSNHVIDKNVIDYLVTNSAIRVNSLGKWILVTKLKVYDQQEGIGRISKLVVLNPPLWLLRYRFGEEEQQIKLFEAPEKNKKINKWIFYTEASYNLVKNEQELNEKFKPNLELMKSLSDAPKNWSSELDEDLAELIKEFVDTDMPGSIRNLIKNISLSSQQTTEDTDNLMSFDKRTYWESDSYSTSYNGCNSIRLFMKPYKIIKKMYITVSKKHRMYMPKDVSVYGGDNTEDIDELNKITIKLHDDGDVLILENCKKIYNYIEIRIKSCQRSSTNCRVYGIKIYTSSDQESLSGEIFTNTRFQRNFPRLAPFKTTFLYRRAELLLRFIKLFDICMDAMLPSWTYSDYFENSIKSVKKLLILSTKRINLLEKILNSIPTTHCYLPLIYIDRQLAFATRGKPGLDPKYQNTIFMQIYHNLSRSYSFRWDKNVEQWWECKFYGEGIIDQGGGFRDSLSDMAEELCPNTSALDSSHSQSSQHQSSSVPLPFFMRSPNQLSRSDSNTFRDTFTVNPSCTLFDEYEFIGKLMGACFRSKETLALYLAPFFWKKLSGETVSWTDYSSIDAAEVKLIEHMEKINKNDYELKYGELRTWTCLLSDGTVYKLKEDGADKLVSYEERLEYCEMVKRVRMNESDKQIDAIRRGLQSVLSKHIFCLLTWSEFELKICGAPNITVEDLRMSIVYEDDMSTQDKRVKYFWEAISNFSNDERSKFVRFVTGRKRLPVKILFCLADQPATSFPDTSTCNCSIYFPNYPNAQVAEEKLRYAIHNCVAIDTDCASYDDL